MKGRKRVRHPKHVRKYKLRLSPDGREKLVHRVQERSEHRATESRAVSSEKGRHRETYPGTAQQT